MGTLELKCGRGPAVRPAALKDLAVYANGVIPRPPATFVVPGQKEIGYRETSIYPIDGNSRYGDCVIAGRNHLRTAAGLLYGNPGPVIPESQTIREYLQRSPQDSGLVEAYVLREWRRGEMLADEPLWGYAPVSTTSLLQQHQGISMYGGLMLGIQCPASAQEAFERQVETNQLVPWVYEEGSPIVGGHCIVALGYGPNGGLHCATWGGIVVVTPSFLAHFLDEAWVLLSHQLVEKGADTLGLNLKSLEEDLKRV